MNGFCITTPTMLNTGLQNKVGLVPVGTGIVLKFGECCAVDGEVPLSSVPAQNSAAIATP